MAAAVPPVEEAKRVFSRLGYAVEDAGDGDLRAERKWRTVRVTALGSNVADAVDDAEESLRCFVAWSDHASEALDRLERADLNAEWALIGVAEDGAFDIVRPTV
jgi:hypothetical protein